MGRNAEGRSGTLAPAASLVLLRGRERMGRTDWEGSMSVELISVLIAVLAIGVAQSGLILTSNRGLREDMARMEARLREDMKQLSERVARVEHSQAKLEGLLEGLREAITVRSSAS